MADESKLLQQAQKVKSLLRDLTPKRKATIRTLRVLADELLTHHNNVCIAQVAGSSISITGCGVMALGFGLSFLTGGTSLIVSSTVLAAVGAGMGAAGGVTNAGSSLAEICIQKGKFDTAQKIIDEDRKATEAIAKLWGKFSNEIQICTMKNGAKVVFGAYNIVKGCAEASYKVGKRVAATAASEGGEALFRGLGVAGKVAHISGFAFSVATLPLDIYSLVTNAKEIDAARKGEHDKEPEAVKKLRELADQLEKDMHDKNELIREIDDLVLMATTQDSNPLDTYL